MVSLSALSRMRPISADSHVMEPPSLWAEFLEPAYRDLAPYLMHDPDRGDIYVIPGMVGGTFRLGGAFGAGRTAAETSRPGGWRYDEIYRGAWDPAARLADMDRDGLQAELIYPTAGMIIMAHEDLDYQAACLAAYNRWLAGFVKAAPDRLFGVSPTAARTPGDLLQHIREAHAAGFKGVMLPEAPGEADYDSPAYDAAWEAAVDLGLPLCFHILPGSATGGLRGQARGGRLNAFTSVIRGNQDIIGVFVFGGVFQRHPKLKLICVEADAGWAPHYMYRMDGAYERHRQSDSLQLERKPSEYFLENVYMTFQDDALALKLVDLLNPDRLLWATDFPHTDSTWPRSRETMVEMSRDVAPEVVRKIVRDNAVAAYGLGLQ